VSEIEPFPCRVLAHHYPETPNFGDMTRFKEWPDAAIDVLVGGTPCQSFSVAGLRKGLADPRGNLMLTFGAIAAKYRPRWVVWENVPGVLSSGGGRDFATFLGMLAELGYGFAYRILDAQFAGVPQRRRRVFVVGCLGDWRRAAAVLLERASLRGDSAPRREAREGIAGRTARSLAIRGRNGTPQAELGDEVANAILTPSGGRAGIGVGAVMTTEWPAEVSPTLGADYGDKMGLNNQHVFSQNAGCFVAHAFDARQSDVIQYGDRTGPLDTCGFTMAIAFAENSRAELRMEGGDGSRTGALSTGGGKAGQGVPMIAQTGVRRLTPRECERLQGFPDDYTAIPLKRTTRKQRRSEPDSVYAEYLAHAPIAADGPRYKALGNSMAVPVMRWIGQRIAAVDAIETRAAA
jgi:DNA (cytosine-5)-methyltransferase 1